MAGTEGVKNEQHLLGPRPHAAEAVASPARPRSLRPTNLALVQRVLRLNPTLRMVKQWCDSVEQLPVRQRSWISLMVLVMSYPTLCLFLRLADKDGLMRELLDPCSKRLGLDHVPRNGRPVDNAQIPLKAGKQY